jgi:hypothetical protein
MVGLMIRRVNTQYFALVFFFTLCQVIIGTTCALSDLSVAEEIAILLEEGLVCPMEGTTMCPPSLILSPERHIKGSMVSDVGHAPILLIPAAMLTVPSAPTPTLQSWSSVLSIAPIFIGSSSVLRI